MSRKGYYQYSSARTLGFLDRYQSILDDMKSQGLDSYVAVEFEELSRLVGRVRALAATESEGAMDLSRRIGPRVGGLPSTARQARAKARAAEAKKNRATTVVPPARAAHKPPTPVLDKPADDLEATWARAIAGWSDYLALDLAHQELTALRDRLGSHDLTSSAQVERQLAALRVAWEGEAATYRQAESADIADQERATNAAVLEAASAAADGEEVRRNAVRAVMSSLEDAGFQVENPRLVPGGSAGEEVLVVGTRPSGASATFNLTLDGKLEYDFSGYRGSDCETDIDSVTAALQDVYGIVLSEEVVAWRNPDDLDATSRPRPGRKGSA